jgi:hypothetical protein
LGYATHPSLRLGWCYLSPRLSGFQIYCSQKFRMRQFVAPQQQS